MQCKSLCRNRLRQAYSSGRPSQPADPSARRGSLHLFARRGSPTYSLGAGLRPIRSARVSDLFARRGSPTPPKPLTEGLKPQSVAFACRASIVNLKAGVGWPPSPDSRRLKPPSGVCSYSRRAAGNLHRSAGPTQHVRHSMSGTACPTQHVRHSMSGTACPTQHVRHSMSDTACPTKSIENDR